MIRYAFAGSDTTAADVLGLLSKRHKPEFVITREDAAYGRKREIRQTPVADIADSFGIEVIKTNVPENEIEQITSFGVHRGIVVSYGAILKEPSLEVMDWFNLHFSLLPKLRGAAPVQRAILDGVEPTGVSLFKIDAGMDTGPIYRQLEVDIEGMRTSEALEKLSQSSMPILFELLSDSSPALTTQSGLATRAPKLSRDECQLDFSKSADDLSRVVRAAYPEPVAWTTWKQETFRIIEARSTGVSIPGDTLSPGQVEKVAGKIYVACGDNTRLELVEVQPFSKKPMAATDWFNGVGEATLGN